MRVPLAALAASLREYAGFEARRVKRLERTLAIVGDASPAIRGGGFADLQHRLEHLQLSADTLGILAEHEAEVLAVDPRLRG